MAASGRRITLSFSTSTTLPSLRCSEVNRRKKGIVGIEAAIVLIAFVVVAAALAFVTLNMGFYTTQRSKEVMASGLAQASSALEIEGSVLAKVQEGNITHVIIPIRVSAGQKEVDLTPGKADIAVWVIGKYAAVSLYNNTNQAVTTKLDNYTIDGLITALGNNMTVIVWSPNNNGDTVLQAGEKAYVVINFSKLLESKDGTNPGLAPYDVFKVEIKPPIGSSLTVERTVPATLAYEIIDLG